MPITEIPNRNVDLLQQFLDDCSDSGENPIVVLCILLQSPTDNAQVDISQMVAESALALVDWDDESSVLAHEVASLIGKVQQRQVLANLRDALWGDEG